MKFTLIFLVFLMNSFAFAEVDCDLKLGLSTGVPVVEFTSGNTIHSKMSIKEMTPAALEEEMINLQDEGICTEKIPVKKCVLKFEKQKAQKLTLYRGQDRWLSWPTQAKREAQNFVKGLQKVGFCS